MDGPGRHVAEGRSGAVHEILLFGIRKKEKRLNSNGDEVARNQPTQQFAEIHLCRPVSPKYPRPSVNRARSKSITIPHLDLGRSTWQT